MTSRSEFMVSIDGRNAPSKPHGSCAEAMIEAERLARMECNKLATIRVLRVEKVLVPVFSHEWRDHKRPETL